MAGKKNISCMCFTLYTVMMCLFLIDVFVNKIF